MNVFLWRSLNCRVEGNKVTAQMTGLQLEQEWVFPAAVKHAHAMDQNIIVVLIEDGNLWQCGAVPLARLIPSIPPPTVAAAAG